MAVLEVEKLVDLGGGGENGALTGARPPNLYSASRDLDL